MEETFDKILSLYVPDYKNNLTPFSIQSLKELQHCCSVITTTRAQKALWGLFWQIGSIPTLVILLVSERRSFRHQKYLHSSSLAHGLTKTLTIRMRLKVRWIGWMNDGSAVSMLFSKKKFWNLRMSHRIGSTSGL